MYWEGAARSIRQHAAERYFSANSHVAHRNDQATRANMRAMEDNNANDLRIRARDAATRMLSRLTAGVAVSAITAVGVVSAVSAYTIPGIASTSSGATASTSTTSGSTSTGLSSSGSVSSSSGSGVAVSGGS